MKIRRLSLILIAAFLYFNCGCSSSKSIALKTGKQNSVQEERTSKDESFRSDPDSPISSEDRIRFRGLSYFPVDPGMKLPVRLIRHSSPESVRLATNTGEIRSALRYGYFEFYVQGQKCRLQVYRLEDLSDSGSAGLFIPFRDATTGTETYSTGRYIDLKENTVGKYELDFNRAYNPYCAYNPTYSCPVPPIENTLTVAIRAGEKSFH
jgi:uncharacterized protein